MKVRVTVTNTTTGSVEEERVFESHSAYVAAVSALSWDAHRDTRFTLGNMFRTEDGSITIKCRGPYRIDATPIENEEH